jgi:signal transduction histidine kinase
MAALRRRVAWGDAFEDGPTSTAERALMARVGLSLLAAGGTLGLASLAFPGGAGRADMAILATALAAYALAAVEFVAFDRLPPAAFQVLTASATVLVSAALYFGGEGAGFYLLFYFWVVLYAAYLFPWRLAALQTLLVAIAYGIVLVAGHSNALAPLGWFLAVTTVSVVAALVVLLKARLERLLANEREQVQRLRELDHLKDEFIATVSHELRTPLAAVYGSLLTLQRPNLGADRRDQLLDVVYRESDRLVRFVNDVLWTSRLDTGALQLALRRTNAVELAGEVVEAARTHTPETLSLALVAPRAVPPIEADPDQLRRVLGNLLENAIKYSPEGGRVEVKLEPNGAAVRFSVRDEGIGIPRTELERVFEKFYRADPHMTRGVSGTGLGLYICRELVRRMNGHIWVASEPDKGSTFAFELPLAARKPA